MNKDITSYSFLEKMARDLIKNKKSHYSEDCIGFYLQQNKFAMEEISQIRNQYGQRLKCTYVKHKESFIDKVHKDFIRDSYSQRCIVYLHGLGSNRLEGLSILPHMPKNYSLVIFDLSGSGKSEGDCVTYGYKEKDDIEAVLSYLYQQKGLRNFVIWGRSMGAVSTLLYAQKVSQQSHQQKAINPSGDTKSNKKKVRIYKQIKCLIVDSPFSSFESIAKDIASRKMSIPQFLSEIALSVLKNIFDEILQSKKWKKNFSPFQINFNNVQKQSIPMTIPMIFIYSLNDEVVSSNHSEVIISRIKESSRLVEKIIMPQCGHNYRRPVQVFETIFQKIQRNLRNLIKSKSTLQNQVEIQRQPSQEKLESPNLLKSQQIVGEGPKQNRKNLFTRENSQQSIQGRKRGLSLSSKQKPRVTLGRPNSAVRQNKENFTLKNRKTYSMELKNYGNCCEESPRKNSLTSKNFTSFNGNMTLGSARRKPSLSNGHQKNRIFFLNSKIEHKQMIEFGLNEAVKKNRCIPEKDKKIYMSTISYTENIDDKNGPQDKFDLKSYRGQTPIKLNSKKNSVGTVKHQEVQQFHIEYLNTIDVTEDCSTRGFINKKLEFQGSYMGRRDSRGGKLQNHRDRRNNIAKAVGSMKITNDRYLH